MIPKIGMIYFSSDTSRRVLSVNGGVVTFFQRAEKNTIAACTAEEFELWFFSDRKRHMMKPSEFINDKDKKDIKEIK